ncbi:hypothetical protein BD560DRAFT_86565 [Blakeslea trispora]|nr:hypothetical protein BD560DRAFT_86565 [Blakeslea trispora]
MTIHSRRSHLIPPFSKNTNIFWGDEGLDEILTCQEFLAFHDEVKKKRQNEFDCAPYPNTHYANRKRHSNGSIVYQKEQTHSTLPPLPTMESFMTMMNMPHAPESPCLTARSTSSSVSSSHSTINSLLLDDVSVRLAKVNLDDPSPLLKKNSKEYALSHKTSAPIFSSVATPLPPPPVPPKDFCLLEVASYNPKKSLKCIDTYVDYRHEKPSPVSSRTQSKKRRTAETPKTEKKASRAKSAQRRPPIPPRQSSIPSHEPPKQIGSSQLPLNIPTHHRKPADLDKRYTFIYIVIVITFSSSNALCIH